MGWDFCVWLLAFFVAVALLGLVIYQLLCLADLEFDYINPYDSSACINKVVYPEFAIQGVLSLLFLLSGHWFVFSLSAPLVYYHLRLYVRRRHLVDVTEIFNLLDGEKKYRMVKLGYYLLLLFISIFGMVSVGLEEGY